MSELTIKIEIGNDAMSCMADASDAIHTDLPYTGFPIVEDDDGIITDYNGNKVGTWEVTA